MTESYNYIKALHIIFVTTWFAGLFYIPRLFMYQIEAWHKPSPDKEILGKQLALMAKRLWYIITWPSAVLATIFGVWMLILFPSWLTQGWMLVKIGFVVLLYLYHGKCHQMFKQLQANDVRYSTGFMRIWNEGATIILFSVVFLVVLKSTINWVFGVVGIIGLGILLMLGIRLYKRIRRRNPEA